MLSALFADLRRLARADERSSAELARATGIGDVAMRKFLAGMRDLSPETAVKLAKSMGYEVHVRLKKSAKKS